MYFESQPPSPPSPTPIKQKYQQNLNFRSSMITVGLWYELTSCQDTIACSIKAAGLGSELLLMTVARYWPDASLLASERRRQTTSVLLRAPLLSAHIAQTIIFIWINTQHTSCYPDDRVRHHLSERLRSTVMYSQGGLIAGTFVKCAPILSKD